jgi:hypothetical protein
MANSNSTTQNIEVGAFIVNRNVATGELREEMTCKLNTLHAMLVHTISPEFSDLTKNIQSNYLAGCQSIAEECIAIHNAIPSQG